jgi:hypothetical protein
VGDLRHGGLIERHGLSVSVRDAAHPFICRGCGGTWKFYD